MCKYFNCHGGGTIKVNNPSMIDKIENCLQEFRDKSINWHKKLLEQGVTAYRCNDGWVDREKQIVTFFFNDRTEGYYWGNPDLSVGDKIFIGSEDSGGRFAIVDYIVDAGLFCGQYHYKFIS